MQVPGGYSREKSPTCKTLKMCIWEPNLDTFLKKRTRSSVCKKTIFTGDMDVQSFGQDYASTGRIRPEKESHFQDIKCAFWTLFFLKKDKKLRMQFFFFLGLFV